MHNIDVPDDWALRKVHLASQYVEEQFWSHVHQSPSIIPPIDLDVQMALSCAQLASTLANAYMNTTNLDLKRYSDACGQRPTGRSSTQEACLSKKFPPSRQIVLEKPCVVLDAGYRIIFWYVPAALSVWMKDDISAAMHNANDLLRDSIFPANANGVWRTDGSYFHATETRSVSPGCINVSPCWFQQGHEPYGHAHENTDVSFCPDVSATLKSPHGLSIIKSMQRPSLLISAALRVMHPSLYWDSLRTTIEIGHWAYSTGRSAAIMANRWSPAHCDPQCCPEWFDIMTCIGNYPNTHMKLPNLGIELVYDSGVMVAFCGRLVQHEVDVRSGDRWVWAWFMRDSVHNHFKIPRGQHSIYAQEDYAKYSKVEDISGSM
ncbi:uncharacterized protein F5891DRAFT_984567 [Suillus fuscotomentosus]|uniref:Uncharacterized protein n=1 Tax=Suillus fuscotomentosus TaxID=1912939 RepID=A0AAD4DVM5_9AGAM|nr:uncharacterized protein F5891DRAFT_984567 [Suillus fuscotomentosus]KAG1894981.1 hypothetical protein F5891DRAFT_984567 [Suillus fuscotomentosus]